MVETTRKYTFEPDYAIASGTTLWETMEALDMSQKELATRTGLTQQSLNRIFKGEQPISYETANLLELAVGVPASMWNNLEAQYREQLAKIYERERLQADLAWLKDIPVAELVKRSILPKISDKVEQLRSLLAFYGVSSVEAWHEIGTLLRLPHVAACALRVVPGRHLPGFAWESLKRSQWSVLTIRRKNSKKQIRAIAQELDITPGIVVGRYQFLTKKWHVFNDLKGRLEWA